VILVGYLAEISRLPSPWGKARRRKLCLALALPSESVKIMDRLSESNI